MRAVVLGADGEVGAGGAEGFGEGVAEVLGAGAGDLERVAGLARHHGRDHVGPELDPVRAVPEIDGVEPIDALDRERLRAEPVDLRAHLLEHLAEDDDVGLGGDVFEHGLAVGHHGGEHHVDRRADGDGVEAEVAAFEPAALRLRHHVALFERDLGAERLHPFEVEVDGAGAPRAAAGERDAGLAAAAEERAEHVERGAHLLDEVVGRLGVVHVRRVDHHRVRRRGVVVGFVRDGAARDAEHVRERVDIVEHGHVAERGDAVGEDGGGHERERRVLRAADVNGTGEGASALNDELIHERGEVTYPANAGRGEEAWGKPAARRVRR